MRSHNLHRREVFWLVNSRGYNASRGCNKMYDPPFRRHHMGKLTSSINIPCILTSSVTPVTYWHDIMRRKSVFWLFQDYKIKQTTPYVGPKVIINIIKRDYFTVKFLESKKIKWFSALSVDVTDVFYLFCFKFCRRINKSTNLHWFPTIKKS